MKTELHLHTNPASSCARNSVEDMLNACIDTGFSTVCITDHHSLDGWNEAQTLSIAEKLTLIPASEISFFDKNTHLDGDFIFLDPNPDKISEVIKLCDHNNGGEINTFERFMKLKNDMDNIMMIWAHPTLMSEQLDIAKEWASQMDAVEEWNGSRGHLSTWDPELHRWLCEEHIPRVGGSDAHSVNSVNSCFLEMNTTRNIEEILSWIKGNAFEVCSNRPMRSNFMLDWELT